MADRVLVMEHGQLAIDDGPGGGGSGCIGCVQGNVLWTSGGSKDCVRGKTRRQISPTVREGRLWLEECLGQPGHETPEKNKRPRLRPHTVKSAQSTSMPSVVSMHDVWFRYGKTSLDTLRRRISSTRG